MRDWTGTRVQMDALQIPCRYSECRAQPDEPCIGLDGSPLRAFPAHTVRITDSEKAPPLEWLRDRDDDRVKAALKRECGICEAKPGEDCRHPWNGGKELNRVVHQSRAETHLDKRNKAELSEERA